MVDIISNFFAIRHCTKQSDFMISWQFGGATFGTSDVPHLKRKDKLV